MNFGHKDAKIPEESQTFQGKDKKGTILTTDYDNIQSVVESVQPPAKQFNGPKRIDPKKPLRRCQEWTAEALKALEDAGILSS
jgi:hypothetical protein